MEAGNILLKRGLLDQRQLAAARQAQGESQRLDQTAVELGFITEEAALTAIGDEMGIDFIDLASAKIDLALLKDFPSRLIHRQSLFPIERHNGSLRVATSDPFDLYPLDELSAATGLTIEPVLASRVEIGKLIKTHLGVGSETIDGMMAKSADDGV
ncbi:MAG TPA: type II/IV secretion system protein, partial [Pirellulales bacterium]|nr:type II/IV secretion system protein [Pirellulales bacterium]